MQRFKTSLLAFHDDFGIFGENNKKRMDLCSAPSGANDYAKAFEKSGKECHS